MIINLVTLFDFQRKINYICQMNIVTYSQIKRECENQQNGHIVYFFAIFVLKEEYFEKRSYTFENDIVTTTVKPNLTILN